eukprot:411221_1
MSYMNLSQVLSNSIIEEWKEHYVGYDILIKQIASSKRKVFGEDAVLEQESRNCKHCTPICCAKTKNKTQAIPSTESHNEDKNIEITEMEILQDAKSAEEQLINSDFDIKSNVIKQFNSILENESNRVKQCYLLMTKEWSLEYTLLKERINSTEQNDKQFVADNHWPYNYTKLDAVSEVSEVESDTVDEETKNSNNDIVQTESNKPAKSPSHHMRLRATKIDIRLLYHKLVCLSNFATINKMVFEIIVDKFNKELKCDTDEMLQVPKSYFIDFSENTKYMNKLVKLYANMYEFGDYDKAKTKLLDTLHWQNSNNQWMHQEKALFCMGTKFGIMVALIVCTIAVLLLSHIDKTYDMFNLIYIYRCLGVLLAFMWFWAVVVYIFSHKRINYIFIFHLNPETRLTFMQIIDSVITMSILYWANILLFIETHQHVSSSYSIIWPISLFIFAILRLLIPYFRHWSTRKLFLKSVFQCMIAPFGRVEFRDFFVGDILTSLSKVFVDIYLSVCVIIRGDYQYNNPICRNSQVTMVMKPILICLPYWFRFLQCINRYYVTGERKNNGLNALKYGLSSSVTLLGVVHSSYSKPTYGSQTQSKVTGRSMWLVLTLIQTAYVLVWDIQMDWNMFPFKTRIKSYPIYWYYLTIIIDTILRFSWTFTLFPSNANPYFYFNSEWEPLYIEMFFWLIYTLEVFRRCVWAVFRVEKAHNGQKEEFRKFTYIPLFIENNNLKEKPKTQTPLTMKREVISMCLLLVVITVIIAITGEY